MRPVRVPRLSRLGTPSLLIERHPGTAIHLGTDPSVSPERSTLVFPQAAEYFVGGYASGLPVRIPCLDIVEVGTGGGSEAWVDAAGGLHVGPRSAGASPGPACYGLGGTAATVTDAAVVLGGRVGDDGGATQGRVGRIGCGAACGAHVRQYREVDDGMVGTIEDRRPAMACSPGTSCSCWCWPCGRRACCGLRRSDDRRPAPSRGGGVMTVARATRASRLVVVGAVPLVVVLALGPYLVPQAITHSLVTLFALIVMASMEPAGRATRGRRWPVSRG